MKKRLAKKITLGILTGAVLMSSSVVWADNLVDSNSKVLWEDKTTYYLRNEANNSDGTVPDGDYSKAFYGAYGSGDTGVTGGKVNISAGTFSDSTYVYGGRSSNGDATDNKVTIGGEGTQVYADVYGGSSNGSAITKNTVTINGGTISGNVYGGYALKSGAVATDNTVTISGGKFIVANKNIYGGYAASGNANENKVAISGGTFAGGSVYGGYTSATVDVGDAGGNASNNTVTISKGTFGNGVSIYGGYTKAGAGDGDASDNIVTISGGSFEGNIEGGGTDGGGNAIGNIVTISGGSFTGEIYGGKTLNSHSNYNATKNTVNISGNAVLENAKLYGGFKNNPYYGGTDNPNTLNIGVDDELQSQLDAKGITVAVGAWNNKKVKSIAGFDVINFAYVNWEKDGTVVEVTDKIELATKDDSTGIQGTAVTVGTVNVANGGIAANDTMHLLELTSAGTTIVGDLDGLNSSNKIKVNINEGVAKTYNNVDCAISKTANTIDLVIKEALSVVPDEGQEGGTPIPERNDQVLVLGESRAAAVAFTNQGSELIETGLNALTRDNSKDTKVFAAVYGNHSEYETGSHVNVNGWSGIVGIGKTNANGLTVGAFFENGEGNYSTHNDYNAQYIRGDGEACYNGGGLLVRKDNANGVYAEASLRAGNLQNELRNAVRNGADLTGYDVDTFYYGAHIGIGKVIPRGADGDSLDVYGKFIYTHHDGETFDVGGTPTKFDSVESERLRLGFRLNEVQTNKLSMYYGAAWEYEFNGDAHDKIASFDLETPSLEGSTVIGEVGMHYKASEKWSLDLNARAYTGQREGFSGSVQANYSF